MKRPTSLLAIALRVVACGTILEKNAWADCDPAAKVGESVSERVDKIRKYLAQDAKTIPQSGEPIKLAQWVNWVNWNNWPNWGNWNNWNNWMNWVKW
jgi:hypothetical protein